jgi:hypothetical protein
MGSSRLFRPTAVVLGALSALFWAASARAFCHEVAASTPGGYDPAEAGCFDGLNEAGVPAPSLWWRSTCVGYSLQQNASIEVSLSDAEQAAQQAFDTWHNVYCADAGGGVSIRADQFDPVQCDTVPSAGHNNPIIFRDTGWSHDAVNALGFTTLTVDLASGEIIGADIEINTSTNHPIIADVDGSVPGNAYSLESILLHEAGHFLGLAHSQDTSAIMYAYYPAVSTALTQDDMDGICSLYPPDTSRQTADASIAASGCNPDPPLGFETTCGSLDASVFGSGPIADGGTGGGDPPCNNGGLFSCTMGRSGAPAGAGFASCGVALGLLLRWRKRAAAKETSRARAAGLMASLAFVAAGTAEMRRAEASVSITVLFDDLVQRSTAVAVVVPDDQRAVWEEGHLFTYTHAHVDRVVAGQIARDVWLRTRGGELGGIGQIVEGQPTFVTGQRSLVFVTSATQAGIEGPSSAFAVLEGAQGQFPVVASDGKSARLSLARDIGGLVPAREVSGRFAREVLVNRELEDAAKEIAAAWVRAHRGKQ